MISVETTKTSYYSWPTIWGAIFVLTGLCGALAGLILQDWFFMGYGGICELAAIALLILGWRE